MLTKMKRSYFYVKLLSAFSDLPCIFCLIILGDGGDAYITSRTNVTKHWLMNILRILEFDTKYLLILVSQSVVQMAYDIHCDVFSAKTSFTKK